MTRRREEEREQRKIEEEEEVVLIKHKFQNRKEVVSLRIWLEGELIENR